ncbi:DEAD/DEAH box helicase [Qipengyuania marisflavi]|uniref:DEAD/DEAH box helicase n=1 Tax=Qipengyuania marisflavi TaxID=2486356 RepID=A0A5S3P6C2_9SPHN|nr:DEAD/DEAH box helicase [Qipengyuania marisflavi]TMM48677.1 DEAD/DEAH box helicase [Qipengyuania marisflavi]
MPETNTFLAPHTPVSHPLHGSGQVIVDSGDAVVVRFGGEIHSVLRSELVRARSLDLALESGAFDDSAEGLLRASALAIRSVNDQWGVFSRSRVQLLPHQLWVCHKVNRQWPFRWLVADDVGLGKTIEAGLVLMPLVARAQVRRLLILAPAKLVPQWQKRLYEMFDLRLQMYGREIAKASADFWGVTQMVVASVHTLRQEVSEGRAEASAFLDAEPWDAVVVDEAHHLHADDRTGETLSLELLKEMERRGKIKSLLLFTGTPHRGKDHGFFSLLSLLDNERFGPDKDPEEQLAALPEFMIRNNKAKVTDLKGEKLFTPVTVESREYQFSDAEAAFYDTLSAFIIDGRAYASNLSGQAQTARMLLLIALQKLAASSIAAIRSALIKRRDKLASVAENARATIAATDQPETLDDAAVLDEEASARLLAELMDGEVARLEELLDLAEPIVSEQKIERLVELIVTDLPEDEPVLLFTEYKATQALVVNALHARFGYGRCAFINGEGKLENLLRADGSYGPRSSTRETAADDFNAGKVRFLVSTEAAGEGIDLQERCATLVHVDMPWNPMRLHQRVGRLSRYGQTRPVQVFILRNPATVEARIWDLLNAKLERIQAALDVAMDEREDISQLVVGLSGPSIEVMFAEGQARFGADSKPAREGVSTWFDQASATIGGEDLVKSVRNMLGNVTRFDFAQVGNNIPKVDLPDLERFLKLELERQGKRAMNREDGMEVIAPDEWRKTDYAIAKRYTGLVFDRNAPIDRKQAPTRLIGIGHSLLDRALKESLDREAFLARCSRLKVPLLITSITDEITGHGQTVGRIVVGACRLADGTVEILRDWELLKRLNLVGAADETLPSPQAAGQQLTDLAQDLIIHIGKNARELAEGMTRPSVRGEVLLVPEDDDD